MLRPGEPGDGRKFAGLHIVPELMQDVALGDLMISSRPSASEAERFQRAIVRIVRGW